MGWAYALLMHMPMATSESLLETAQSVQRAPSTDAVRDAAGESSQQSLHRTKSCPAPVLDSCRQNEGAEAETNEATCLYL